MISDELKLYLLGGLQIRDGRLTIDPLREPTHRQLMWLLARSEQRQAALEQYEKCREWLLLELGVVPEEETTAVYEAIAATPQTGTRPLQPPPSIPPATINTPPFQVPRIPHFVGRSQPLADLEAALTVCLGPGADAASQTPPRWGIAGMGGPAKKDTA